MTPERILLALMNDIARLGNIPDDELYPWDTYLMDTIARGVPYKPAAWFGPMSATQRTVCMRATRSLLKSQLVHRISEPARERIRFLFLTSDGVRHGLTLVGPDFDRVAFWEGLRRTHWGRGLVEQRDDGEPIDLAFSWSDLENAANS